MKMTQVEKDEITKALQLNANSQREAVALYLAERAGKPLKVAIIAKAVFDDAEATAKVTGIVRYIIWKTEVLKLNKKYKLTSEVDMDGARVVTFTIAE
jgi:hypothetical protein